MAIFNFNATSLAIQTLWGYQDFAAGAIAGTSATLTTNENGIDATFNSATFYNFAEIYKQDGSDYVYSAGVLSLFSRLVKVSSQVGVSITLNRIPDPATPCRIWYLYKGVMPSSGYILPPQDLLNSAAVINLDNLFVIPSDLSALPPLDYDYTTGIFSLNWNTTNLKLTSGALDIVPSPQFTGLNLSGVTASSLIYANGSKNLASVTLDPSTLTLVSGVLTAIAAAPSGAASGDLSATYPNPTVAKINGNPLGLTTATNGNVLINDGVNWVSTLVTGDVKINPGGTTVIGAAKVTNSMLAGSIDPGKITLASTYLIIGDGSGVGAAVTTSGDVKIDNAGITTIGANKVLDTMLRQSTGLSVIGRSASTTGDVADIAAASDFQVLRRSGTALAFGSINLASSNAVTGILPNGNTTATDLNTNSTIVARDGSGNFSAGTITANLMVLGSGNSTLLFGNGIVNRKIELYRDSNNDHQFYGLGINAGVLRYQTSSSTADHVFYSGINTTSSLEVFRIKGNGIINIPGLTVSSLIGTDSSKNLVSIAAGTYALDSAVVHNTGDEAIAGIKTFSSFPKIPQTNMIYLSATNGSDSAAANGSVTSPYATIAYALTQITTASATNPFGIFLATGQYFAPTFVLKPNVSIFCNYSTIGTALGTAITMSLDAGFNSVDSNTLIKDANFTATVNFAFDLSSKTSGTTTLLLDNINRTASKPFNITGTALTTGPSSAPTYLLIRDCFNTIFNGTITADTTSLTNIFAQINNSTFVNFTCLNSSSTASTTCNIADSNFTALTLKASGSSTLTSIISGMSKMPATWTIDGTNSVVQKYGPYDIAPTLANGATFNPTSLFAGTIKTTSTTASTTTTTGCGIFAGGVGVAGSVYIGGDLTLVNAGTSIRVTTGTHTGRFFSDNATTAVYIGSQTSSNLFLRTNDINRLLLDTSGNLGLNSTAFAGGSGVFSIQNASVVPPSTPVGYYALYVTGGALKGRGTSGTLTTIGPADPHCKICGMDFANEWENDKYGGQLMICNPCKLQSELEQKILLSEVMTLLISGQKPSEDQISRFQNFKSANDNLPYANFNGSALTLENRPIYQPKLK